MILLNRPSKVTIESFLAGLESASLTYNPPGITNQITQTPFYFTKDHCRVQLGNGEETYNRAILALKNWQQFNLGWLQVINTNTPIVSGATVGLLCSYGPLWVLFACRIIYIMNEGGAIHKFGFAYGTLPGHPECGEERFTVEWHQSDNSVWYDILAYSYPGEFLTALGYPLTRALQKKFARESQLAMLRA
jgi:uncharacterized protein (UPF0548 family)